MGDGQPEDRHHLIANVFFDRPLVAADHLGHRLEKPAHHRPHLLRVQTLGDGRAPGDIGEENRHDFALFGGGRGGGD